MNFKPTLGSFVVALLVPASAHAATLVYQGSTYENVFNTPVENCVTYCPDPELAEFDTSMALTVTFEIDGPLQASAVYDTNPFFGIGVTFVSGSDGVIEWPYGFLNGTPTAPSISFSTDASANITSWIIEYSNSGNALPDLYSTRSDSFGGDSSGWDVEYVQSCQPGTFDCTNGVRVRAGRGFASTSEIGTWTVLPSVPPAPVPLPATGWLGLFASLAWLFTGFRKSRRLAQG